ncbi:MAG: lamin tail domain-containing protein [Candidatus Marinimicrobia bacterium]|nr:lamin tail domain-containing protein [Candidatus Neomarinimicrobiota bacterium]
MKLRIFFILSILIGTTALFAGDLFFSEYIEGSSNNKAIEIYNASGAAVDLSHYTVKAANNGSGWGCFTNSGVVTADTRYVLPLSGTLNAGDVYVIYNTASTSAIVNVGDLGFAYNATTNGGNGDNVPSFNGDDALGLFKDGVLIDVIGVPTTDPGDGWAVAGTLIATKDYTLVRKSTVSQGDTVWTVSAGTTTNDSEWIVYAKDTFNYIGSHIFEGGANVAPMASAGTDRVERFNATVTLDGSASNDPDGSIVSYVWTQVSGTSVTLSASDQATVSFTSPTSVAELTFQLVVTDDSSATGKDTVTIYIDPSSVIISEYVEGSSNNKYLEIYNASDASVNLIDGGYSIKKASNGAGVFATDNEFSDWGSHAVLASGQVIVLAHESHAIFTNPDTAVAGTYSVMSFNGNDAVGLFRNGLLVDVVGEPSNSADIIVDKTLRRKNTVLYGNSTYNLNEWDEYAIDNIENLGLHSTNPNAPQISGIVTTPDFVTSANEITVTATITPVVGTISTAKIWYGSAGSLVNSTDMWLESGNSWTGAIPAQTGNSIMEFKITTEDNSSPANSSQSSTQSLVIAADQPATISSIHTNISSLTGKLVTIKGVVTVGAGQLNSTKTSVYIQDASGRGLNLYDAKYYSDISRGDELIVIGYAELYNTTVEITDFLYKKTNTGVTLPTAQDVTIAQANSSDWEGTWISMVGPIDDFWISGTGQSVKVKSGTDSIIVRIWNTTGIDTTAYLRGNTYRFNGIGSKYTSSSGSAYYQLLVAYLEDITLVGNRIEPEITQPLKFALNRAYPNPFNATTKLTWQLDKSGDYELAIFNMLGQKVEVIGRGYANAGSYTKTWNASHLPSGVYFVQLRSQNKQQTQKLMYLK